jgi:hypothetical protein
MKILDSYDFVRPYNGRWVEVIKALMEDGVFAVRLERGEDFPEDQKIENVQNAISQQIIKAGGNPKTFIEDRETKNVLIVSLRPEGEERAKRAPKGKAKTKVKTPTSTKESAQIEEPALA